MNPPTQDEQQAPTLGQWARMVDMRIPLPYLLTGAIVVASTLAGMYYSLQQLQGDMRDVKLLLKSADANAQTFREELAVQKYRLSTLEGDVARLRAAAAPRIP